VGDQRAAVRGLGAKRRSPLMNRAAKQADRGLVVAGAVDDPRQALAALHVEMLCVYCWDAELFASNGSAGLL
jgi:hypothetical protein